MPGSLLIFVTTTQVVVTTTTTNANRIILDLANSGWPNFEQPKKHVPKITSVVRTSIMQALNGISDYWLV